MHEGHRERMRGRAEREGVERMEPHNVLELLLFYTIPRGDTNETAHRLIDRFGSLSAVLEAPVEELVKVSGVGEKTAFFLHLLPGITKAYLKDKTKSGAVLDTPEKAAQYLIPNFIGATNEIVVLVCLDNKSSVKNCSVISEGSINMSEVGKRQIAETVLRNNASSVILAHNHPNGVAAPSKRDVDVTYEISSFLSNIDVKLSDHIIISNEDWLSMASTPRFAPIFI